MTLCAKEGYTEIVRELLSKGAYSNLPDRVSILYLISKNSLKYVQYKKHEIRAKNLLIFNAGAAQLINFLFLALNIDTLVVLGQVVRELLVMAFSEDRLLPKVRRQIGVGAADGGVRGLGEVSQSGRLSTC